MKLEIWYQQDPASDYGAGEPAICLETAAELDNFLDRVLADNRDALVPPMIEVSLADHLDSPVLQVGLAPEHGFIAYLADDGGLTRGPAGAPGMVSYDYMGNVSEVPAHAEVSIRLVRQALQEFAEHGTKPAVVEWQQGAAPGS
jgi:hypothetical protein